MMSFMCFGLIRYGINKNLRFLDIAPESGFPKKEDLRSPYDFNRHFYMVGNRSYKNGVGHDKAKTKTRPDGSGD